ncbi:hypothetical protein [Ornithinimicrobium kibberense]|uniref:hypothetical protein n=1 Tax=Ornithinimicrobium kibberense TaxID=282060 RepID=UPI003608E928
MCTVPSSHSRTRSWVQEGGGVPGTGVGNTRPRPLRRTTGATSRMTMISSFVPCARRQATCCRKFDTRR